MNQARVAKAIADVSAAVRALQDACKPTVGEVLGVNYPGMVDPLLADVADCPADSAVGERVIALLQDVGALLDARIDETDIRDAIIAAAVRQCNVWYFG